MFLSKFVDRLAEFSNLEFEPIAHQYKIESKSLKSVTRLLGESAPEFNADEIVSRYNSSWQSNPRSPYYQKTLDEIKEIVRQADYSGLKREIWVLKCMLGSSSFSNWTCHFM